jgi:hypothetical protein
VLASGGKLKAITKPMMVMLVPCIGYVEDLFRKHGMPAKSAIAAFVAQSPANMLDSISEFLPIRAFESGEISDRPKEVGQNSVQALSADMLEFAYCFVGFHHHSPCEVYHMTTNCQEEN